MSAPAVIFFVNLATLLNVYLRCFVFCFSKRDKSNQILQFLMLFCRIKYFPAMQYEIPPVLFFSSCALFSGLLSLGHECAHYTTVSDFFPSSFLNVKEQP